MWFLVLLYLVGLFYFSSRAHSQSPGGSAAINLLPYCTRYDRQCGQLIYSVIKKPICRLVIDDQCVIYLTRKEVLQDLIRMLGTQRAAEVEPQVL